MKRIALEDLMNHLEKRKRELGIAADNSQFVMANPGGNRTPEKVALLKAIKEEAEKQGRQPTFKANI